MNSFIVKFNNYFSGKRWWIPLVAVVILFASLLSMDINRPFIGPNEDNDAMYGMATDNWVKYGALKMRFGNYAFPLEISETPLEKLPGNFYIHHPQGNLIISYWIYKIFGVSDWSTRLGPILISITSVIFLWLLVRLYYNDIFLATLTGFIFSLLPGNIFWGRMFGYEPFTVSAILLTALLFFLLAKHRTRLYTLLFFASILWGGFMDWPFYLILMGLWLWAIIDTSIHERKFFLWSIPLAGIVSFFFNILHFYILNGAKLINDLKEIFLHRSWRDAPPFEAWQERLVFWLDNNYTRVILYAIVAYLLYFIIDYFFKKRESKRIDFLPILFLGVYVVNTGIFREWSMHAFSNFYLNPGAALIAALLVYQVITNRIVLAVFLILFIANARMNIKKTFEIEVFGRRDAALIKSLETVVPRGESLCLGGNLIGAMYDHLTRYYLRRLQKCDDQSKHFLIFNEAMGQWYTDEKKRLVGDLQPVGCGMLMCYYRK